MSMLKLQAIMSEIDGQVAGQAHVFDQVDVACKQGFSCLVRDTLDGGHRHACDVCERSWSVTCVPINLIGINDLLDAIEGAQDM